MSLVSQEIRAVALADELSLTIKIVVIEGKCVIFFHLRIVMYTKWKEYLSNPSNGLRNQPRNI